MRVGRGVAGGAGEGDGAGRGVGRGVGRVVAVGDGGVATGAAGEADGDGAAAVAVAGAEGGGGEAGGGDAAGGGVDEGPASVTADAAGDCEEALQPPRSAPAANTRVRGAARSGSRPCRLPDRASDARSVARGPGWDAYFTVITMVLNSVGPSVNVRVAFLPPTLTVSV